MGRRTDVVRVTGLVVVTGLVAATLLPAPALAVDAGTDGPAPEEIADARDERDGAEDELSEVDREVRRVNDQVAALDATLTDTSTELVAIADDLAAAERAHRDAVASERDAAAELADAGDVLDDTVSTMRGHRDRLANRAVHAFKHGSAGTQDVLVRGVAGASDWHDVAVTLETVGRMSDDDRALVAESITSTRDHAAQRSDVHLVRTRAIETARTAASEEQRVRRLVAQQEQAVDRAERAHDERAEVLSGLESDASARAVLVADLEARVEELESAAADAEARRAAEAAAREAARQQAARRAAEEEAARVAAEAEDADDPDTVLVDDAGGDVPWARGGDDAPPPTWAAGLPGQGRTWAAAIDAAAERHGLDARLLAALVWTESNFRPDAVSHAGALGLTQLMPGTARGLGVDPRNPEQNLDGGARYLRAQLDTFGRVDLALAAYNAGPNRVQRAGRVPDIVETQLYVVRTLERYERLRRTG